MTDLRTPPAPSAPAVPPLDFGRRVLFWRLPVLGVSTRVDARALIVFGALLVATVIAGIVAVTTGDFPVPLDRVLPVLAGNGTPAEHKVIVEWRLPRMLLAIAIGASLGVAGAIFQSLTRNPLGSPDIIGFNTGAYTGALAAMLLFEAGFAGRSLGAVLGGAVTALAVFVLASKRGVSGYRLIVVGIGIGAMLSSFNTWLILTSELRKSLSAATWGVGTLTNVDWEQVGPALVVFAALILPTAFAARNLSILELGDDAARAMGVSAGRARSGLVVVAVCLVATGTAVAGPIGFVALVAPQITRRLLRSGALSLPCSAMMGAALLLLSDVLAQRLFSPLQIPVGLITVSLGGIYLTWLLVATARTPRSRA